MKSIHLETIEIEINEANLLKMQEYAKTMKPTTSILIRNKKDAQKLSRNVSKTAEKMRKERYIEAIENDDYLYLKNYYNSFSTFELIRLLFDKLKKRL